MVQIPLARLGAALLAAGVAVSASAQTTGSMIGVVTDHATGKPLVGVQVVATSPQLQGQRVAITERDGTWRLDQLPPGTYVLQGELLGYVTASRGGARLGVDMTLRVNLSLVPEVVTLDETVVKTGQAPAVDVGSAETGLVVEEAFIETVPVRSTSFANVAIAAPTAQTDTFGIGFAGAQSLENRYAVEGLDVTDPQTGALYVPLVSDFVEQVDVKAGNYAAEYGRATGGLVSAVTKSGSNAVSGSVFFRWLEEQPREPTGNNGQAIWSTERGEGSYVLETGAEVGGPIVQDRLWFHVGFAPQLDHEVRERELRANVMAEGGVCPEGSTPDSLGRCRDRYNTYLQTPLGGPVGVELDKRTFQYHGKLTWSPTARHTLSLAAFGTPYQQPSRLLTMSSPDYYRTASATDVVADLVGRWNGRFLEGRLLTEVLAGYHLDDWDFDPDRYAGGHDLFAADPILWLDLLPLGSFEQVPADCGASPWACPVQQYRTGGYAWDGETKLSRLAARASAALLFEALGSHILKAGVDVERSTAEDRYSFAQPFWYAYTEFGYLESDFSPASVHSSTSFSPAVFVQDAWQPVPSVTLNLGLRWEGQYMDRNEQQLETSRIRLDDALAPRLQVVWDPTGTGRAKLGASYGRFYESIPLLMGQQLGEAGGSITGYFDSTCAGFPGPTGEPIEITGCQPDYQIDYLTSNPVAPDLKSQYVDQFALTAEWEPIADVSVGVTYEGRRLGRVVEDVGRLDDDGLTVFIANPGESGTFEVDGKSYSATTSESLDPFSRRTVNNAFPRPERRYDGLTFRVAKAFSKGWLVEASYTLSRLTGNFSGLFRPENNQLAPNLTSEYDLPTMMTNRTGYLPADRTHVGKLYGAYRWNPAPRVGLSLGGAFTAASGIPVNALAIVPIYDSPEAFVLQRGDAGRTPWVHQLDLRGTVDWAITHSYTLQLGVDVFNVYRQETMTRTDERWTMNYAQPIVGAPCTEGNPAGAKDPVAGVLAACPDLAYLKTLAGIPVVVNPNYGRARGYQIPRAWRFSVTMAF